MKKGLIKKICSFCGSEFFVRKKNNHYINCQDCRLKNYRLTRYEAEKRLKLRRKEFINSFLLPDSILRLYETSGKLSLNIDRNKFKINLGTSKVEVDNSINNDVLLMLEDLRIRLNKEIFNYKNELSKNKSEDDLKDKK